MKDFYYILGIPQTASAEDIKKAYRKLSQKFHPDKNDGDPFFAERFQEIKEAYNTLIEPAKRTIYDADKSKASSVGSLPATKPVIEFFKTDKTSFAHGETVTFYWKTSGANKVVIKPFGQVPMTGEKTYRLKDFKNPTLAFELIAERTGANKQASATITLHNTTYEELYQFFKRKILGESGSRSTSSQHRHSSHNRSRITTQRGRNEQLYATARPVIVIVAIVVIVLLMVLFVTVL